MRLDAQYAENSNTEGETVELGRELVKFSKILDFRLDQGLAVPPIGDSGDN
ncbi:hypothetical protein BOTU111921_18130 [Bordetella tumbae]